MMKGRIYREVPSSLGTQSCSSRTSSVMPARARSSGTWGRDTRPAEAFIRRILSMGRKSCTEPSAVR